jgi:hypothetical protein
MYGPDDFSIHIEDARAKPGTIIVVAGRAMLMKDVEHKDGYEIDALPWPRAHSPTGYDTARPGVSEGADLGRRFCRNQDRAENENDPHRDPERQGTSGSPLHADRHRAPGRRSASALE